MYTEDTDVYVIGSGTKSIDHLTREALDVIKSGGTIFLLDKRNKVRELTKEFADEYVHCEEYYEDGIPRKDIYKNIADEIVTEAKQSNDHVTFISYGHPVVFVTPTQYILDAGESEDLNVDVLPGVSATACLFADMGLDPQNGIQMYEATDMLLRKHNINTSVPMFLWQIGVLETKLNSEKPSHPNRFQRLKEYLQEWYPDQHTVYLTRTATNSNEEFEKIPFQLESLEECHDIVTNAHTLYVPPSAEPGIRDDELSELLESEEHLDTITTP